MNSLCKLIEKEGKKNIDVTNWKKFKLTDLFSYEKGKDRSPTANEIQTNQGVFCAVAKNNNSGFAGRKINPIKIFPKGKLILVAQGDGGAGMCFVADEEFCANACVYVLTPLFKEFNKYVGLFLATIISKNKSKFNHQKGINNSYLEVTEVLLPSDSNGNPDWNYMENLIIKLELSTQGKLWE